MHFPKDLIQKKTMVIVSYEGSARRLVNFVRYFFYSMSILPPNNTPPYLPNDFTGFNFPAFMNETNNFEVEMTKFSETFFCWNWDSANEFSVDFLFFFWVNFFLKKRKYMHSMARLNEQRHGR